MFIRVILPGKDSFNFLDRIKTFVLFEIIRSIDQFLSFLKFNIRLTLKKYRWLNNSHLLIWMIFFLNIHRI